MTKLRKTNYHTHTMRCNHAVGLDEDYVKSALRAGYTELGFSEHGPWNYASGYVSHMRLSPESTDEYLQSIRALAQKYKDEITIKIGLESEYFPEHMSWLRELVAQKQIDYVLFGNHFYPDDETGPYYGNGTTNVAMLRSYHDSALKGMQDPLYAYFAHPDLFMRSYPKFDENARSVSRSICQAAKQLGVLLEYNLAGALYNRENGVECYPHRSFWEIAAEEGCTAILGVDAHDNDHLEDESYREEGLALLKELGIPVTDTISFLTDVDSDK